MRAMRVMKNRKSWMTVGFLVFVVALIGALVLTACAPSGNGGNGRTPRPRPWVLKFARATTGIGGTIGIDPMTSSSYSINALQSESLIHLDRETLQRGPGIATSWEFNREEMYIDYWLRDDVRFHNGDLVTAEDVKFSWDRCFYEELVSGWATILERFVDSVEVVAEDQVRIYVNEWSWSYFAESGGPPIIPQDYIEDLCGGDITNAEGWIEWAENPVLTGPFKVVDWELDNYAHLVKAFDEHWYYGAPPFDEAYIYVVVEPSTRLAMLKAGEVDIANIPPANVPDVENDPNLTLVMSEYSSPWMIRFYDVFYPSEPSPLLNPDVRRAVSLAIDREGIAENVFSGTFEPWGSFYPPYHVAYRYREPDTYDPDEAQRLLEEAGYPDGFDTVFSYPLDRAAESEAVIASLVDVGIRAEATGYEPTTWATMLWTDQHRGMGYIHQPWWGGSTYFDIGQLVYDWGAQGTRNSPEIAAAYDAQVAAPDLEAYTLACQAAEDVFWELDCQIVLWAVHGAYGYTNDTIEDWQPWPGGELDQNFMYVTMEEYL